MKNIYILLLAVLVWSCQDSKTKQNSQLVPKNKIEDAKKTNSAPAADNSLEEMKPWDTITELTQKEFKPFMGKYGEKHPQTKAVIKTEFGNMEVELFEDTPLHRANFIYMANLGYFNSTFFYRVDPGFVIQAGNSDNQSVTHYRQRVGKFLVPKEFHSHHRHKYGALAAAKFSKQNVSKASSPFEFYIVMDPKGAHHLDEEHTVFGRVTKGMEVAEKIAQVPTEHNSEWPVDNVEIEVEIIN